MINYSQILKVLLYDFNNNKKIKIDGKYFSINKIYIHSFLNMEKKYKGNLEIISVIDQIHLLISESTVESLYEANLLFKKLVISINNLDYLIYCYILLNYYTKPPINKNKYSNITIKNMNKVISYLKKLMNSKINSNKAKNTIYD
jgi:hypothetical protein